MEETSLTDFVDDGEARPDPSTDDGGREARQPAETADAAVTRTGAGGDGTTATRATDEPADETVPVAPADVSPAASTAAWSPDGRACERCGDVTGWRFSDGHALVCSACTAWDSDSPHGEAT